VLTVMLKAVGGARALAFLAVAALALSGFWAQTKRLEASNKALTFERSVNDALTTANEINRASIDALTTANAAWVASARKANAEAVLAADAFARERIKLQAQANTAREDRQRIYRSNNNANAWGSSVVPAVVFDSMRAAKR